MGEGEGRDWAAVAMAEVDTIVCLTEENASIQGKGVRTRSNSGGRIECVALETGWPITPRRLGQA